MNGFVKGEMKMFKGYGSSRAMWRGTSLLVVVAAALAGCGVSQEMPAESTPSTADATVPPLDTQVPAETRTATFALG
jgi:hypothetical protein